MLNLFWYSLILRGLVKIIKGDTTGGVPDGKYSPKKVVENNNGHIGSPNHVVEHIREKREKME